MAKSNAAQKQEEISQSKLPSRAAHLAALGKFPDQVLHAQVLVMQYTAPERTQGGIILTPKAREEDRFQGKVGLVVAMGPGAFEDAGQMAQFHGKKPKVGDWVLYRTADGMEMFYNGCSVRLFEDVNIKMIIKEPTMYW
jgi:co-chaperonin GroES (HSP10)